MTEAVLIKELSSKTCREHAATCRELTRLTMTAPHRVLLEHIARTWDKVASEIDTSGRLAGER